MSEVIFPDWIPNWTIASWDRILFSDTSDAWTTKDDDVVNLPISTATQTAIDNKVDKVTWKGLSTNDYDNTEKANVAANTSARHTHTNKTILDQIANNPVETIVAWANITVSRTGNSVTINSTWSGGGWGWDMYKAVYDPQNIEADAFDRANHTWTQTMSTISDAWALATLDQVDTAQIINHAVENTKLANMNSNTLKGRLSWNGTPQDVAMADLPISTATQTALNWKQETLVSWTNIKTVNWTSLLWSWDIVISGGGWTQMYEWNIDWQTFNGMIARFTVKAGQTLSGVKITGSSLPVWSNFTLDVRRNWIATTNSIFTSDVWVSITTAQWLTNWVYTSTKVSIDNGVCVENDVLYVFVVDAWSTLPLQDLYFLIY